MEAQNLVFDTLWHSSSEKVEVIWNYKDEDELPCNTQANALVCRTSTTVRESVFRNEGICYLCRHCWFASSGYPDATSAAML